jgi:hypothetical protein
MGEQVKFIGTRRILANTIVALAAFACGDAALPSPVAAQEAQWEFALTPYLWATGIKAKVSPPRLPSSHDVDVKFSDILDNLDGLPVIVGGEVRYGRFGLVGDLLYLPLATRINTRNLLFNDGKSEMSTLMVSVAGFYRVADGPDIKADVGAGLRLWSISSKTTLNAGLLPAASTKFDKTFADPILAVRASLSLADRWSVTGYFDMGAFGISSSELTWQLLGTVNYRAADWVELRAGWRHLGVKRDDIKVNITGPIIGATFRF